MFRESIAIVFESYTKHIIHCEKIVDLILCTQAMKVIFDYNLCI